MRMLLVEDDRLFGDGVCTWLGLAGYAVDWVRDGAAAEHAITLEKYSVILLDLQLPRLAGMEILRRVRQRGDTTPVIILTAQDRLDDRLLGLDNGADDYLIKPFALEELSARIRALLRRSTGRAKDVIEHRDVAVDLSAGTVTQNGENIDVSPREFALLRALLEKKGKPVSRELLETLVYSWDNEVESNAVAVHIHNLRRKFGEGFIKTKRGFGYFVDN